MVSSNILISKINNLKEYIDYLSGITNYSKDEYIASPMIYASFERFLHLSIECVLDIGNHIISDLRYRKPESNRDIFEVLYENNIISLELKEKLIKMADFRNILVHDYMKLDREIVYTVINNNLGDIEEFIKIIADFINILQEYSYPLR